MHKISDRIEAVRFFFDPFTTTVVLIVVAGLVLLAFLCTWAGNSHTTTKCVKQSSTVTVCVTE